MDAIDLKPLVELLNENIDNLEEALGPVLKTPLVDTVGKLPLLDKAQLYVLIAYAVESMLFSYLRLNGVNAREHPIFEELSRVKHYFEKIKTSESAHLDPYRKLDKAAAGRFIKHALAGNERMDQDMAKIKEKGTATHTIFEETLGQRK